MSRVEKPSVLLVDDNEPTRTLVTALLHREFEVHHATDGVEAMETLKTRSFAAILLDLRMPHVDGFEVLEFLRESAPDVLPRVIVVTAAVSPREIDRVKSYGICEIVRKPFDVETLLDIVRTCCGSGGGKFTNVLCSSGPMILLIADLLRRRLM